MIYISAVNQFVSDTVDFMLGDFNLLVVQRGIVNFTHGGTGLKGKKIPVLLMWVLNVKVMDGHRTACFL